MNQMKVTQTDTYCDQTQSNKNVTFIVGMESRKYAIYATLYHPELQSIDYVTDIHWNTLPSPTTDEIAYRVSRQLNIDARKNSNRVRDFQKIYVEMAVEKGTIGIHKMLTGTQIRAFGYN